MISAHKTVKDTFFYLRTIHYYCIIREKVLSVTCYTELLEYLNFPVYGTI